MLECSPHTGEISPQTHSSVYPSAAVRRNVDIPLVQFDQKSQSLAPSSEQPPSQHTSHSPQEQTRHKWKDIPLILANDETDQPSQMAAQSTKLSKSADTEPPILSERHRFFVIYSLLVIIRLHFALSNSYIHPDEHFQGPEVVVGKDPASSARDTVNCR